MSSFMPCDINDGRNLTWAYEVYDYDNSNVRVDCVIVGSYPDRMVHRYPGLADCEKLSGWAPR